MAYEIEWAESALAGLTEAVEYIARDSPSYAAKTYATKSDAERHDLTPVRITSHTVNISVWNMKMKANVTLKLDADLLREARVIAAEDGRSLSALLTEKLEGMVRERRAYEKARHRALDRLRAGLDLQWTRVSKDELHER